VVIATVLALGITRVPGIASAAVSTSSASALVKAVDRTYDVCTQKTAKSGADGSKSTVTLGINDCSKSTNIIVVKTFKNNGQARKAALKAPAETVWVTGSVIAYSRLPQAPRFDALMNKLGADIVVGNPPKASATTTTTAPPVANVSTLMAGTAHPTVGPGTKGELTITYVAPPVDLGYSAGTIVPVIIWNGTGETVSHLDVSGTGKDASGTVLGAGDAQDIEPQNLAPNEVAFGLVYFTQAIPAGSAFDLTPSSTPGESTYFLDAQVNQANFVSGQFGENSVTGEVANPATVDMRGPIEANVFCFSDTGVLTDVFPGFVEGNAGLAAGATGGFSTLMYRTNLNCPTFLVGASGYGSL
jgi:hypothetical protein